MNQVNVQADFMQTLHGSMTQHLLRCPIRLYCRPTKQALPSSRRFRGQYLRFLQICSPSKAADKDGSSIVCAALLFIVLAKAQNRSSAGQCEIFALCEQIILIAHLMHINDVYRLESQWSPSLCNEL